MKDAVAGFALLAAAVLGRRRRGSLGGLSGSPEEHHQFGLKFIDESRANLKASKTAATKEKQIAYALEAFNNAVMGVDNAIWSESPLLRLDAFEAFSKSSARLDKLVFAAGNPLRP